MSRPVLLIDNLDSFTFNLVESLERLGAAVSVLRSTIAAADAVARAETHGALILLSPGPGTPAEAGSCLEIVARAAGRVPVLGVCLGHQAIVQAAGGSVVRAPEPVHGKASRIVHDGAGMFAGVPSPCAVGRYHSLCTRDVPARFRIHAMLDGMAMAISDPAARQYGVQFHPESVLTRDGDRLLANILAEA